MTISEWIKEQIELTLKCRQMNGIKDYNEERIKLLNALEKCVEQRGDWIGMHPLVDSKEKMLEMESHANQKLMELLK